MAKKKSAAQKAKAKAAAAAAQHPESSDAPLDKEDKQGVDPEERVAASVAPEAVSQEGEGAGSELPENTDDGVAAPAKKKRNRRGKGSRKKKKAGGVVGEGENDDEEAEEEEPEGSKLEVPPATADSPNTPEDDMDSWVEVERKDAESPVAVTVDNAEQEEVPLAQTPAHADDKGTADEREYLLSGRKIHAPDPVPDVAESSAGLSLDDLAHPEAKGNSSDSGDDMYGAGADDDDEEEEEDEMAEVLELLIEEFAQRHGRLPNEDEIDQWRDAIASSELMSGQVSNQEAAAAEDEEARRRAFETANYASSSSEESDQGSSEGSDDEHDQDVKPLMSRRLSANQMQMLLNRSDYEDGAQNDNEDEYDDEMASEDDSEDSDEGRNEENSEEDEDYEETSADGSGEVDDVKPLMSRRLSANQLQILLNRGDYEEDADESDGSAESEDASGSAPHRSYGNEDDDGNDDDDGVGAWPKDPSAAKVPPSTLSAAAQRKRYAVALTVAAKFKGEGAVGPRLAAALKDLVLVDDPLVMGPVDAFLMAQDFEVLVQQLYAVAVNAASVA